MASFSRLAFVFDDPLGATPVKIFLLSLGVKLTKSTAPVLGVRGVFFDFEVVLRLRTWNAGVAADFGDGESDSLISERGLHIGLDCGAWVGAADAYCSDGMRYWGRD